MYHLEKEQWGPYEVVRLEDHAAGTGFSVAPQRGACLLDLHLGGRNVLDGYGDASGLESLDWAKSALLAPFPNRLKDGRYRAGGEEYQFPLNDVERGNALHGFVLDKPFEVGEVLAEEGYASMVLKYAYAGDLAYFPFPFLLRVSYSLKKGAGFEMTMEMENTGVQEMPAGMGWHPYFGLGAPVGWMELELPPVERVEVDGRMIPTGEKTPFVEFQKTRTLDGVQFDTGFRLLGQGPVAEVALGLGPFRLGYWQDQGFPFLQVFTPPARRSIALEPMTCNIDAFHNGEGLRMLRPGERIQGKAGIRLI